MTSNAMRIAPMSRTCFIVWENARLMKNLLLSVFDDLKSLGKRYHVQRPKSMERMTLVSIKIQYFLCSLQNNICVFLYFYQYIQTSKRTSPSVFPKKKEDVLSCLRRCPPIGIFYTSLSIFSFSTEAGTAPMMLSAT